MTPWTWFWLVAGTLALGLLGLVVYNLSAILVFLAIWAATGVALFAWADLTADRITRICGQAGHRMPSTGLPTSVWRAMWLGPGLLLKAMKLQARLNDIKYSMK